MAKMKGYRVLSESKKTREIERLMKKGQRLITSLNKLQLNPIQKYVFSIFLNFKNHIYNKVYVFIHICPQFHVICSHFEISRHFTKHVITFLNL